MSIIPSAHSVEPLNGADASLLKQIDARIERVEYHTIQGERSLYVPRNAAVKEGDEFFVMVSPNRSIENFVRKEFKLGDTWDAEFVEVKAGLTSDVYILVKNNVAVRQNPLTPTLVSASKRNKLEIRQQFKPNIAESQPVIKPNVTKPRQIEVAAKYEADPKPGLTLGPETEFQPVAIAVALIEPAVVVKPAKPQLLRARPVLVDPNPAPVLNYKPEDVFRPAVEVFPVAVEAQCAHDIPAAKQVSVKHAPVWHKAQRHFSGRRYQSHRSGRRFGH